MVQNVNKMKNLYKKKTYNYIFTWKKQHLMRFNRSRKFNLHRVNDFFLGMWLKNFKYMFKLNLYFRHQNKTKVLNTYKLPYKFNKQFVFNRFFLDSFFWNYTYGFIPYYNNKLNDKNYSVLNKNEIVKFGDYNEYFLHKYTIYNNNFLINKTIYRNSKKNFFLKAQYKSCYSSFFKFLNILYFKYNKNLGNLLNTLFMIYFIKNK